jgi:hypothetical protein
VGPAAAAWAAAAAAATAVAVAVPARPSERSGAEPRFLAAGLAAAIAAKAVPLALPVRAHYRGAALAARGWRAPVAEHRTTAYRTHAHGTVLARARFQRLQDNGARKGGRRGGG